MRVAAGQTLRSSPRQASQGPPTEVQRKATRVGHPRTPAPSWRRVRPFQVSRSPLVVLRAGDGRVPGAEPGVFGSAGVLGGVAGSLRAMKGASRCRDLRRAQSRPHDSGDEQPRGISVTGPSHSRPSVAQDARRPMPPVHHGQRLAGVAEGTSGGVDRSAFSSSSRLVRGAHQLVIPRTGTDSTGDVDTAANGRNPGATGVEGSSLMTNLGCNARVGGRGGRCSARRRSRVPVP